VIGWVVANGFVDGQPSLALLVLSYGFHDFFAKALCRESKRTLKALKTSHNAGIAQVDLPAGCLGSPHVHFSLHDFFVDREFEAHPLHSQPLSVGIPVMHMNTFLDEKLRPQTDFFLEKIIHPYQFMLTNQNELNVLLSPHFGGGHQTVHCLTLQNLTNRS
jgi:hypothetical protein